MKREYRGKVQKAAGIALDAFLAMIIVFLVYYDARAVGAPSERGGITVFEVKENYDIGHLTVEISRPVVSGFTNKDFERQLNLKIQNQILLNRRLAEMGTQLWFDSKYELSYSFRSDYWVKSSEGILSLKVTTTFWHYNCGDPRLTSYFNADIANNKPLTLGSLFTDNLYEQRINKLITDDMIAKEYGSAEDFEGVSDKTKFFIMGGNLYIAFSAYEIASGSMGEPEFLIPTDLIKDILKPKYTGIFK